MNGKEQFFKSNGQDNEIEIQDTQTARIVLDIPSRVKELECVVDQIVDLLQKMQDTMGKMIQAQLLQVKIQMEFILVDVQANPDRYEGCEAFLAQIKKDMKELFG